MGIRPGLLDWLANEGDWLESIYPCQMSTEFTDQTRRTGRRPQVPVTGRRKGGLRGVHLRHYDASNAVSKKLGYRITHTERSSFGGAPGTLYNLELSRDEWLKHRRDDIEIIGLDSCLPMFGLDD